MPSPFPGMDPYLEDPAIWPEFQHELLTRLSQMLLPSLGDRYQMRAEHRSYATASDDEYLVVEQNAHCHLVTLVQVLSTANKTTPEGWEAYLGTRQTAKEAGAHIVDIDLLRQGPSLPENSEHLPEWDYAVTVARATTPDRWEVYPTTLQKRLPRFRLPLGPDERDTVIDLQLAFSRSYDQGGFRGRLDYSRDPAVALKEMHRVWLDELLQHHKLRPPHEAVARLAYFFWEAEGRPHGRDREHWQRAVEQLWNKLGGFRRARNRLQ